MLSLMSINKKFMEYSAEEILEITKDNIYIDGFEIYIDFNSSEEVEYLMNTVYTCQRLGKYLQIHGNSNLSIERQKEYMDLVMKISDILGYRVHVVLHSIIDEDNNISINKTTEYMKEITDYIDLNKIRIGLENLNDDAGMHRLDINEITSIICNNEKLFFTYDIGHEIANFGSVTNVYWAMTEQMSNVHIHSIDITFNGGFDHKPITKNDPEWQEIIKGI